MLVCLYIYICRCNIYTYVCVFKHVYVCVHEYLDVYVLYACMYINVWLYATRTRTNQVEIVLLSGLDISLTNISNSQSH